MWHRRWAEKRSSETVVRNKFSSNDGRPKCQNGFGQPSHDCKYFLEYFLYYKHFGQMV